MLLLLGERGAWKLEHKDLLKLVAWITLVVSAVLFGFEIVSDFVVGVYQIRDQVFIFLLPFLLAIILFYVLNPLVEFVESYKVPRIATILGVYGVSLTLLVLVGISLVNAIFNEIQEFAREIPHYTREFRQFIDETEFILYELPPPVTDAINEAIIEYQLNFQEILGTILDFEGIIGTGASILAYVFSLIALPIILFYFLKDTEILRSNMILVVPPQYRKKVREIMKDVSITFGSYIRGQLVVCLFIGLLTYLGLAFLGVEFALVLGIIAGITNIIPYFGPFIGAVPSVIIALLEEPLLALKVVIWILIVQQIESQLVAPQILGRNLKLHPLAVVTSLIAGGHFFGLIGLILAVPIVAIVRVIIRHLFWDYFLQDEEH